MRQRLEDLGRIAVLLDNVLEHELFEADYVRAKDFADWFYDNPAERQEEILRSFIYGREDVSELLSNIREIARGEDVLNESVDGMIIK